MARLDQICLYSLSYPAGLKETSVEAEIELLSKECNSISVFHLFDSEHYRSMPSNVQAINLYRDLVLDQKNYASSIPYLLANLNPAFLRDLPYQISYFNRVRLKAKKLEKHIKEHNLTNAIHYIYWFDEWASILALVKKEIPQLKVISRVHGFDLHEDRSRIGYFPFRKLQLSSVEKVLAVSQQGERHLIKRYPNFSDKIEQLYLGTRRLRPNPFDGDQLHLLSISNLIPLKRVELIIDALAATDRPIRWTHFGDGELMPELIERAKNLGENIHYHFHGHVENKKILSFIENESISLFINVSNSEGLPLSMMEVQSAGVPILATDVGGVKEIVNEKTGILVDKEISSNQLKNIIEEFPKHKLNSTEARIEIEDFWKNNFDAEKNFEKFVNYLATLN